MDNALTGFLSIETVIFAIVIWFATLAFRFIIQGAARQVAHIFPDKYEPYWIDLWREWMLPATPVVLGGLLAFFISDYPYPSMFASSAMARVFFGLVAGGAAGYAYRFFKNKLDQLLPKRVKELRDKLSSFPPGPNKE